MDPRRLRTTLFAAAACLAVGPMFADAPISEKPQGEIEATAVASLPLREQKHLRRPAAAAWVEQDRLLLTANHRSGTVSLIDVERRSVVDEFAVGERVTAWRSLPNAAGFVIVDERTHELTVFRVDDEHRISIVGRTAVSRYPAALAVSADGATAVVAGRWSHTLDIVALKQAESPIEAATASRPSYPRVVASIPLPFAPGEVVLLTDAQFAAAIDAFSGSIAVVDLDRRAIASQDETDGHNLRGLMFDAERQELSFVGQRLDQRLPTEADAVRSGRLMSNRLWRVRYERGSIDAAEAIVLDRPDLGAADPSAQTAIHDGARLVCLGGTNELAVVRRNGEIARRYPVGPRPVAVLTTSDLRRGVVVNQLGDSVSIVDLTSGEVTEIALGRPPVPYPRDRGERLFFAATPASGNFMSCHSCHTDGHANGRLADTLGDGTYGTPKRVLSLMGTALTDHWAWNGSLRELRDQVRQSFETTMHASALDFEQHDDVVAFLHTLPLPPPREPEPRDEADALRVEQGRRLFASWKCGACHVGPLTYTSQGAFDVGLSDERGLAKFNPPSLRGVGHLRGYFHDHRAATLDDVFRVHGHQLPDAATGDEIDALVRFLQSL